MNDLKIIILSVVYILISLYLLIIFPHTLTTILGHYIGDFGMMFVLSYLTIMTYLVVVIPYVLMGKYR